MCFYGEITCCLGYTLKYSRKKQVGGWGADTGNKLGNMQVTEEAELWIRGRPPPRCWGAARRAPATRLVHVGNTWTMTGAWRGPPPDRGHQSLPQGRTLRDEVTVKQGSPRWNGGDVSQEVRKK